MTVNKYSTYSVGVFTIQSNPANGSVFLSWDTPKDDAGLEITPDYYMIGLMTGIIEQETNPTSTNPLNRYGLYNLKYTGDSEKFPNTLNELEVLDKDNTTMTFGIVPVWEQTFDENPDVVIQYGTAVIAYANTIDVTNNDQYNRIGDIVNDNEGNIYFQNGYSTGHQSAAAITKLKKDNTLEFVYGSAAGAPYTTDAHITNLNYDIFDGSLGQFCSAKRHVFFSDSNLTFNPSDITISALNGYTTPDDVMSDDELIIPTYNDGDNLIVKNYDNNIKYIWIQGAAYNSLYGLVKPNFNKPMVSSMTGAEYPDVNITGLSQDADGFWNFTIVNGFKDLNLQVGQIIRKGLGLNIIVTSISGDDVLCKSNDDAYITWYQGSSGSYLNVTNLIAVTTRWGSITSTNYSWFNANIPAFNGTAYDIPINAQDIYLKNNILYFTYWQSSPTIRTIYSLESFDTLTNLSTVNLPAATPQTYRLVPLDDNNIIFSTPYGIYRLDITTKLYTLICGSTTSGMADGTGAAVRFGYIRGITLNTDNMLYVSDYSTTYGSKIRIIDSTGSTVDRAATDETNVDNGNSDVSGGGGYGFGNNGYIADIPPYSGPTETITIRDPENNIIGIIPVTGIGPDTVWTFRKDGANLYLLQNGKVVWSYILKPHEFKKFTSVGYIGFYVINSRTQTSNPSGGVTYPTLNGFNYIFETSFWEQNAALEYPFTHGLNKASETVIITNDSSVIVTRHALDDDIHDASYVILGGRKYYAINGNYYESPILPRWVLNILLQNGLYDRIKEVEL